MGIAKWLVGTVAGVVWLATAAPLWAQQAEAEKLTLKRVVALAVQNSREVALARLQQATAEKSAGMTRALFRPNLFTGSGAAYSSGFPSSASGEAPSAFNVSYVQTLFNPPLRGQLRAAEERAEGQRLGVEAAREAVMVRAAAAYLELAKVRSSLELLRKERASAQKILEVTRERAAEGLELPLEITRAELTTARVEQRLVGLEGREETLEGELRSLMGLPLDQRVELAEEEVSFAAEQPVQELVALALENSLELKQAERERRAREQRLKGERGGYWPTVDFVGQYLTLARFNNYDDFYRRFERHNVNVGVQVRIPIFSARTSAAVALAQSELSAAELELKKKRSEVELDVRRRARRARELEAAREVARLELKLAQEDVRVLQARFEEGRASLRDLEKARLAESDKWMAFLDADFARQQAQLELLRTTGQIARILQ